MATIDVYVKVVKNNMPSFGHEYQKASMEAVAADYVDFLEELLERTPRPSKDLLIKSARKVHPEVTPEAINSWASKMIEVISFLRAKAKSSTSMTKINPKKKPPADEALAFRPQELKSLLRTGLLRGLKRLRHLPFKMMCMKSKIPKTLKWCLM